MKASGKQSVPTKHGCDLPFGASHHCKLCRPPLCMRLILPSAPFSLETYFAGENSKYKFTKGGGRRDRKQNKGKAAKLTPSVNPYPPSLLFMVARRVSGSLPKCQGSSQRVYNHGQDARAKRGSSHWLTRRPGWHLII